MVENRGDRQAAVHGTMSQTQLSDWTKNNKNITLWCQLSSPYGVLQSIYSENPPVFIVQFLDLLWAL